MNALYIKYIVLFSKMGCSSAASLLARPASYGSYPPITAPLLSSIQDELAYVGAPTWLFNSLVWHVAEMSQSGTISIK